MSKLKRGSLKRLFTISYNELNDELNKGDEADTGLLKRLLRRLEDRFSQLDKADETVMEEMMVQNISEIEMNEEIDARQDYRDKMNDMTLVVEELCRSEGMEKESNSLIPCCSGDNKSRYKLPKLELVKFDGEPKNWLLFWSQFKGIHEDKNLSNEEKFQYLVQATVVDTPARNVVSSFPPTAENYPKAVNYLKTRFGKDKILIELYVRELLKLVTDQNNENESLSTLYDALATRLRALESLGVTSDKYAAMLYPLVESTLSKEILQVWQRMRSLIDNGEEQENQLNQLMKFLQSEVENEIRLKMAKRSADTEPAELIPPHKYKRFEQTTAMDLFSGTGPSTNICIFCEKTHKSQNCISARRMQLNTRNEKVLAARRCFKCLQPNHRRTDCNASIKCGICGKSSHCTVMCVQNVQREVSLNAVAINYQWGSAFLQTLLITVKGINGKHTLRAIIDTGSHQSYISAKVTKLLGLREIDTFETSHSLFGGFVTRQVKHSVYQTTISNQTTGYEQQVFLLDQKTIFGSIPPIANGPWINELKEKDIMLSDFDSNRDEIDVLLGADIASTLFTGKIYRTTEGPVAFETQLGWTLMGKPINATISARNTTILQSLHIANAKIQDLWRLDLIGIHDSADSQSRDERNEATLKNFHKNVKQSADGRYEVALPWKENHQPVSTNYELSYRRLQSAVKKLERVGKVYDYEQIFSQWLSLGIIEEVEETEYAKEPSSYLPHHPVFNPKSMTTPIRPVFDASARSNGQPSLNDCLETGPNLLELIVILLLQFRMKKYGIIADIEKAFLQIGIRKEDRDYLRFFWLKGDKLIVYRHCRVVFGISSSPFLLAATLNDHLDNVKDEFRDTAVMLKKSMYVDNCVTSVDTEVELKKFMNESSIICKQAQFNLRGWVWNRGGTITGDVPGVGSPECGLGAGSDVPQETSNVSVLGLLWNVGEDSLSLDLRKTLGCHEERITKRNILAATHRIYDPLGFTSPVSMVPKKMLQGLVKKKFKWDEIVPEEVARKFKTWKKSLEILIDLKLPRWVLNPDSYNISIHVFTDASLSGYAAVAFLRSETVSSVTVQLLIAKARVSTIRPITIPKLELIACECGAKLAENLSAAINISQAKWYFWSDSSDALSWIKRDENWQIFVHNRVKKIRELTSAHDWRHIPGNLNPADLPSRGCSSKQLINSKWWQGPAWLQDPEHCWPQSEINCNESIVMAEKKNVITTNLAQEAITPRYFNHFSKLRKVIRMIAWMLRWKTYKRGQTVPKKELTSEEEETAERCMWKMVQTEAFSSSDKVITQMQAIQDEHGLWRIRTKLLMRQDSENFRLPILLPKEHIAVERLIQQEHIQMNHAGTQVLRSSIREKYWILQARIAIRRGVYSCKRCKRFKVKNIEAPTPPLPANRVRDASTFEVVGIDLGGPLYLLDGSKSWFVIFTCAVTRAIHLELITSLSSHAFIQALRRFIARRQRPAVIYSDNGTNFSGTENLLAKLNWEEIMLSSTAQRIKWIFNPPSAPWWGGWWERIVGMVKELLRSILGKAFLTYEEMVTILCDCEWTINSRPLTYLSESTDELIPLTPMMFLNDTRSCEVPDLDEIEGSSLVERYKYLQTLRQQLRERFRKEYLSALVHMNCKKDKETILRTGDVVMVETENKKRVDWPLAVITEVYPGIDGIIRSVQLKIVKGNKITITTRPTKRLYLMEASNQNVQQVMQEGQNEEEKKNEDNSITTMEVTEENKASNQENKGGSITSMEIMDQDQGVTNKEIDQPVLTRSGRRVKIPDRLQYLLN